MGSSMIWVMTFKDEKSKEAFEKLMNKEFMYYREFHDHYHGEASDNYGDFYYDMGYLGYAEAEDMKSKLKKIGVIELKQIRLCDVEGEEIIRLR